MSTEFLERRDPPRGLELWERAKPVYISTRRYMHQHIHTVSPIRCLPGKGIYMSMNFHQHHLRNKWTVALESTKFLRAQRPWERRRPLEQRPALLTKPPKTLLTSNSSNLVVGTSPLSLQTLRWIFLLLTVYVSRRDCSLIYFGDIHTCVF